MRPWAIWCVKHNLRGILYVLMVLALPLMILDSIQIKEAWRDFKWALKRITEEQS